MDVAQRLAAKFERYLSSPARRNYSHEPSKRMSQWRASAGRPAYGHLTTLAARKRSICLIVDCSGSMQEQIGNARTLALVLNLLSQQGKVGGHIVLSAIISGGVAVSQAFEFPVSHDVVERIHGFGEGEGLRSALMVHQQKVKTAGDVFVFTDARITDEPINVAGLRQQGIAVCGLYVGDYEESNAHLAEHFERFVVRESLEALIDALLSK